MKKWDFLKFHLAIRPIIVPTYILYYICTYLLFYFIRQKVLRVGEKWSNFTSNWNSDDGYRNDTHIPWKIKSTGYWNSVEFILAQTDSFYGCSAKQGFSVECITSVLYSIYIYNFCYI